MPLITISNLGIGFRGPTLLDSVNCVVESGQKIGLLGRNGAGKTTLMRILASQVQPDHGEVVFEAGSTTAMLTQDVPTDMVGTIESIVAEGLTHEAGDLSDWEYQKRLKPLFAKMNLDPDQSFEALSSGMKRRVLLARAIVAEPDLLLLDEPTNHLDVESIEWLEGFFSNWKRALIFVTHDRKFLQNLATRILEIERGQLFDWSCDYQTFLKRKEQLLLAQEKQDALFDKRLAEEEVWIRQGIKARRTRNEGRVRALEQMRRERADRQSKVGTSRLQIQESSRGGQLVVNLENVSYGIAGRKLIDDFSATIMRGDKVGIIGPNGAGKTTLLKILLGQLDPDSGSVKLGSNLKIAYFDQLRQQLDPEQTILDNVGEGSDFVMINNIKKHVIGYMQDFLFSPDRIRTQIKFLSGGERNRILLAKLFAKPANLIVLDEPTNDLDAETLELLEDRLVNFAGTILTVSHDRTFLDNIVTSTIVFEDKSTYEHASRDETAQFAIKEYVGGYGDWQRQRKLKTVSMPKNQKPNSMNKAGAPEKQPAISRKLNFKERKELETLPGDIESVEASIATIHQEMAEPSFYSKDKQVIADRQQHLKSLEEKLAISYQRWDELEKLSG